MKSKTGSLRIIAFFLGALFILGAIYFLLKDKLTYGGIFGVIGVLILAAGAMN